MSSCPQCAQLLPADARVCPACGRDLSRPIAKAELVERDEHDEERDRDELLAAIIANEGTSSPPPPWVPPLPEDEPANAAPRSVPVVEEADVVPADSRKKLWRRK